MIVRTKSPAKNSAFSPKTPYENALKLSAAAVAVFGCLSPTAFAAPLAPAQFAATCTIAAGAVSSEVTVGTVPSGKDFISQTASFYTVSQVSRSISQVYIATTGGGTLAYFAIPEAAGDGSAYPGATLAATYYADPGTEIVANCYRNGSTTNAESFEVSISGTYQAMK
jgi:hypothetical protein